MDPESQETGTGRASFFLDPTGRLRTLWRLGLFLLGFGMIQIAVAVAVVVAGIGYFILFEGQDFDWAAGALTDAKVLLHLQMAAALPLLMLLFPWVWCCRRWLDRRSLGSLGLRRPAEGWPATAAVGTVAGLAPILVCVGLLWAFAGYRWTGFTASVETWLLVPVLALMAFSEELVARGYLLRNFLDIERPLAGVLISSAFFWIAHGFNPETWASPMSSINLFGAGVVLALAYLASGNLWFPSIMHLAWNLTQGVLFQLPISGLDTDGLIDLEVTGNLSGWLTGEAFGLEASVLMTGGELVLGWILFKIWRRRSAGGRIVQSMGC